MYDIFLICCVYESIVVTNYIIFCLYLLKLQVMDVCNQNNNISILFHIICMMLQIGNKPPNYVILGKKKR